MKKKILVVEDDHAIAHLLRVTLAHGGYDAAVTHTEEGFRELIAQKTDLILLDVMLGSKNGIHIYEDILESGQDFIPVVVLSASLNEATTLSGRNGRQYPALCKPFETKDLIGMLHSLLGSGKPSAVVSPS